MKTENEKLKQFNARVKPEVHRFVKIAASATSMNMEHVVEDMIRFYFGFGDRETLRRREHCVEIAKSVAGGRRPFNSPHSAGAALTGFAN